MSTEVWQTVLMWCVVMMNKMAEWAGLDRNTMGINLRTSWRWRSVTRYYVHDTHMDRYYYYDVSLFVTMLKMVSKELVASDVHKFKPSPVFNKLIITHHYIKTGCTTHTCSCTQIHFPTCFILFYSYFMHKMTHISKCVHIPKKTIYRVIIKSHFFKNVWCSWY